MQKTPSESLPDEPDGSHQLDVLSPAQETELTRLLAKLGSGGLTKNEQKKLSEVLPPSGGQFMVQMAMQSESFSGPLPHPDQLNKFDPETRKHIVQMAVDDQKHVHEMQRLGLAGAIRKDRRGQWMGFGIAIAGLAAAAIVAPSAPVVAGVIATIDLVGMVAVFVVPRAFERFGPPQKQRPPAEGEEA